MRHGKKNNHLGRKEGHRYALLSNLAVSLITHKRIFTTVAKQKRFVFLLSLLSLNQKQIQLTLVVRCLLICKIKKQFLNYSEQ